MTFQILCLISEFVHKKKIHIEYFCAKRHDFSEFVPDVWREQLLSNEISIFSQKSVPQYIPCIFTILSAKKKHFSDFFVESNGCHMSGSSCLCVCVLCGTCLCECVFCAVHVYVCVCLCVWVLCGICLCVCVFRVVCVYICLCSGWFVSMCVCVLGGSSCT